MHESRKVALVCGLVDRRSRIVTALESVDAAVQAFSGLEDFLSEDISQYDCVVVDHSESCSAVRALEETGRSGCPTLVLADSPSAELAIDIFRKGAYHLLEGLENGPLCDAVEEGLGLSFANQVKRESQSRFSEFNDDEHRVIRLVIEGTSNRDIAQLLGLGVRTVERIRSRILAKSGACSLPNAVQFYTLAYGPTVRPKESGEGHSEGTAVPPRATVS